VMAVVLLVLRAVHAGVVGRDDDQGAGGADVAGREQRVGGDVQPDVLHGDDGAGASEAGPQRLLQGRLLVGPPLGVNVVLVTDDVLQYLGARGAGVGGSEGDARLPGAAG